MGKAIRIDTEQIFSLHPYVEEVLARLTAAGHQAFLIGGVVRDGVRAKFQPDYDFSPEEVDVATAASPPEVRALFKDRPIVGVGEDFGVLVIVSPCGRQYEVATFRVEGEYDGRWPSKVKLVRDLEGDVKRRDLTINGLAAPRSGEVIDLVGGIEDLRAGLIRAIGDPKMRFSEDYLRMLRTVRFACQLDGEIEPETAAAIRENAAKITSISWERICEELFRLFGTSSAARGITLIDDYGLLSHVLPEVTGLKGVPQPEEYHPEGDVFVHTIKAVQVADEFVHDPVLKLAVLLHDIGKPFALRRSGGRNMGGHAAVGARMAKKIARRLRLSKQQASRLYFLVNEHMRVADLPKMGRGKQVRFVSSGEIQGEITFRKRFPLFFDLLQLLICDCEASAHRSSGWAPILRETLRIIDHIDRVCGLKRARELINGHTLLEMGVKPGPELGQILGAVHDRILAGEITTRKAAAAAAKELVSNLREQRGNNGQATAL
ncbi:MAG: CCA tRNA nucleotidyltransferase [Candidatus Bipolaricaulota bacterium]|nr:CCA tRNA nucleotidyltransferase [Candidatus Bipolaricaulota bacterium]